MKRLRTIRVALSVIFFVAAVLLALSPLTGNSKNELLSSVGEAQLSPSSLMLRSELAITLGVTLFWLVMTFLFGRIYCSTVCPIGTLCDTVSLVRRKLKHEKRENRFKAAQPVRHSILIIYLVTLAIGQLAFAFLVEPWSMWKNIFTTAAPHDSLQTWVSIGLPVGVGIGAGIVSLIAVIVISWKSDRGYCTTICPIGTGLGLVGNYSPTQIAIDPDRCISCMKCEEVCPSHCVKVVSRYVDNTRCVRCLDCIAECPVKAIGFTTNRNRPATPMMRKVRG